MLLGQRRQAQQKRPRFLNAKQRLALEAQAKRVAWRIVKDWVEAQMALLDTTMMSLDQIFLPYMLLTPEQTVYERVKGLQFALPPAPPAD